MKSKLKIIANRCFQALPTSLNFNIYFTEKNSIVWMFFAFLDVFLQHFPTQKKALIFNKTHNIKHLHTKKQSLSIDNHLKQTKQHFSNPRSSSVQSNQHHSIHSQPNHNKTKTSIATIQKQCKCKFNAHLTHSSANITNTIDSSFPPLNDIKPKTQKPTKQTNQN